MDVAAAAGAWLSAPRVVASAFHLGRTPGHEPLLGNQHTGIQLRGEVARESDEADDAEVNRVLASMRESARSTGDWITGAAGTIGSGVSKGTVAVGTGVATAADKATRHFRSVDLDGDGIPDEARALTVVKGAGNTTAGAEGAVGGKASAPFKSRKSAPTPTASGLTASRRSRFIRPDSPASRRSSRDTRSI